MNEKFVTLAFLYCPYLERLVPILLRDRTNGIFRESGLSRGTLHFSLEIIVLFLIPDLFSNEHAFGKMTS